MGHDTGPFHLYPNPSTQEVFINMGHLQGQEASIQIYDMRGRFLEKLDINEIPKEPVQVDMQPYPSGGYVLRIAVPNSDDVVTKKFVLTK